MPPTHSPLRLEAAILSRMRSEVTRSNWASQSAVAKWATSGLAQGVSVQTGDGRLSHRKAELEQLSMDARPTPKQIFSAHPSDQGPQIPLICGRPPKFRDFQHQ
jgi:hypothetical protein